MLKDAYFMRMIVDKSYMQSYAALHKQMFFQLIPIKGSPDRAEANTMTNEAFEEWMKVSKNAVEPMLRLNEITVRAMESVARQQLDVARDYLDLGTKQASILGNAERPEDLLSEQGQLVTEFGERLINRAQEFAKIATETQQAVSKWAEEAAKKAAVKPAK